MKAYAPMALFALTQHQPVTHGRPGLCQSGLGELLGENVLVTAAEQQCSTDGCVSPAAFRTRTKPAWCLSCIDDILLEGGLVPAEPFTGPKRWRLTVCLACGVRAHYRLDYTVGNNAAGLKTCRACHWKDWAELARQNRPDLEFEHAVLDLLRQFTPDQIAAANPHPDVKHFLESEWWSPDKIAAHVDANGFDLLAMTVAVNDGNDPVITQCRNCRRIAAERLADVGFGCDCVRSTRSSNPAAPRAGRVLLAESDSPALAWWDHEANAEADLRTVTVRAIRSCHWVCPDCQCRFQAPVHEMAERPRRPDCSARQHAEWRQQAEAWKTTPIAEHPELAAAWADDAAPTQVMVADSGPRRFQCTNGHRPLVTPATFLDFGCQFCRAATTRENRKWLADTLPEIASQWHPTRNGPLTPGKVVWGSQRVVWWQADCCGHEWQETVRSRDKYQRLRCPQCRTLLGSVAWENPALAAEWSMSNPISAWQIRPHTSLGFLPEWVCRTNPEHVWWAPLSGRSNGSTCPECRETGKSQVELAHHAAAVQTFGGARSGVRLRHSAFTSRTSWTADILVEVGGVTLVIEYDGAYWHSSAEKALVDERKSMDLLAAGYLLVRLREDDLPSLPVDHPRYREVRVYSAAPRPQVAMDEIAAWAAGATTGTDLK
jgi:hypothetical protein